MSKKVKHNLNDGVFRHIFKEEKNFVEMFEIFTGHKLSPDEIEFRDTDSIVLSKDLKNDISFITKDNRYIFMVEHQSTKCPNMALRMLIYYAELLHMHVKKHELNIYGTVPIPYPKAEFYVAYNGKNPWQKDSLDISAGDVIISAKLINIKYNKLPEEKKKERSSLVGYAYLIQQFEYYKKEKGYSPLEAVHKAAKDCEANGYLEGYVGREEFLTMVTERWTVEQQIEDRGRWEREEGREEGREEAEEKARVEKLESASKLLAMGIPNEKVEAALNLDSETVLKLKESL